MPQLKFAMIRTRKSEGYDYIRLMDPLLAPENLVPPNKYRWVMKRWKIRYPKLDILYKLFD